MAAIATSRVISDSPQADGRRYIRESHDVQANDGTLVAEEFVWMAECHADVGGVVSARAEALLAALEAAEIAANVTQIENG